VRRVALSIPAVERQDGKSNGGVEEQSDKGWDEEGLVRRSALGSHDCGGCSNTP
jgi:hypothetical protein